MLQGSPFAFARDDRKGESLRLQYLDKCFLRNIDTADALHPLFSFLLFFQ